MKLYYQSELDNLDNKTIEAVEDYIKENFTEKFFYKVSSEFDNLRNEEEEIYFLEELADQLDLMDEFNLTDIQDIIIAYMYVIDIFNRDYTFEILKMLENVLL